MPFNKFNDFKGFNGFPLGFQRRAMSSILTFLCPLSSAFLSASPFLRLPVSSGSCLQPQAKRSSNLQLSSPCLTSRAVAAWSGLRITE